MSETKGAEEAEAKVEKMFEYGYRKSNYGPDELVTDAHGNPISVVDAMLSAEKAAATETVTPHLCYYSPRIPGNTGVWISSMGYPVMAFPPLIQRTSRAPHCFNTCSTGVPTGTCTFRGRRTAFPATVSTTSAIASPWKAARLSARSACTPIQAIFWPLHFFSKAGHKGYFPDTRNTSVLRICSGTESTAAQLPGS